MQLSQQNIDSLCAYLEAGLPRRLAANMIGLLEEDLQRWISEDPRREALIGAAEAKFQLRCMEAILAAQGGKGAANIRAIMWLLESRFPDQFGKKKTSKPAKQPRQDPPAATSTPAQQAAEAANVVELPQPTLRNPPSEIRNHATPGRNEKCPCASGFKYKHCCGATNPHARRNRLQTAATPEQFAAA